MKRQGRLFDAIFTPESLHQAYLDARHGKRAKRACFQFERVLGQNLAALHRELHQGAYRPRPYFSFEVYEPKKRTIYAPAFRDCVVQHAIYRAIYPIFDRTFIDTSFACRIGKGTHQAADYVQRTLRRCDGDSYYLQLDIRKFFYRIDRTILRELIAKKIKDPRLVELMMRFAEHDSPTGIPIGNLLSQVYALIYLNPLDHFIKRDLGARHYVRYVDDFILFGLSREQCLEYRARIIAFLREGLALELSKSTIAKVKRGINFVGYRTWRSRRFIRKHSLYKYRRAVRGNRLDAAVSLLGHAKRTQSLTCMLDLAKEDNRAIYHQLPEGYRRHHHPPAAPARGR